jgi:hypothetical protein
VTLGQVERNVWVGGRNERIGGDLATERRFVVLVKSLVKIRQGFGHRRCTADLKPELVKLWHQCGELEIIRTFIDKLGMR